MEEPTSPPPRRQPQNFRSTASTNWRMKDDSPRVESPQQGRQRNYDRDGQYNSSPRGGGYGSRPSNQAREPREIPTEASSPRLYVGNLLYTAQAADVENFFTANGFPVVNLSMSIDPATGRNPSYCFVDLESTSDAQRAMEALNGMEVLGREVRINPGVARKEGQGAAGGSRSRTFEGGRSGGWQQDGSGNTSSPQHSSHYQSQSPTQGQSRRLYVGGLPNLNESSASQSDIEASITNLFAAAGFEVTSISKLIVPQSFKTDDGAPRSPNFCYLFVDLANAEDLQAAIDALDGAVSPFDAMSPTEGDEPSKLRINRAKDRDGGARRTYGDRNAQGQGQSFGSSERRNFGMGRWRNE